MAISAMEKSGRYCSPLSTKEFLTSCKIWEFGNNRRRKDLFDEFVSPSVELGELERRLGELSYCLDFIDKYRSEKPGLLSLFSLSYSYEKKIFEL